MLRPGGRFLLGYRPRDAQTLASLPASVYALRSAAEIEALFAEAGFVAVHTVVRSGVAYTEGRRSGDAVHHG